MDTKKIDKNMDISKYTCEKTEWINIESNFTIHGKINSAKNYSRLPKNIKTTDSIKYLSKHPSGLYIDFSTNSSSINLHVKTATSSYMPHMSAIGQIGLDLYYKHNDNYLFIATTKIDQKEYLITLIKDLPKETKEFRLYLPLYTVLEYLAIGVEPLSIIKNSQFSPNNKIITYGTSITQGGCATRPGMSYPSILGRLINFEIINLGFSGNCHLNYEIAETISTIKNLKYLIIEPEANINDLNIIKEKLPIFINIIKRNNKNVQIIIITHFPTVHSLINPNLDILRKESSKLINDVAIQHNVNVISGKELLKEYCFDESVDGIHLTDLGFYKVSTYLKDYILELENK